MSYEVSRREVLNNLTRFKSILSELYEGKGPMGAEERRYKALLNVKTGDIRFAQKISALEPHINPKIAKKEAVEDWKEIYLIVRENDGKPFEIRDRKNRFLKPSDMESLAWKVASETLEILNLKGKEVKARANWILFEEAVLQDLSNIQITPQRDRIEELPGWMGSLDRIDAEKILTRKPVGTYLLREGDELTMASTFHFAEENLISVHPYLLTVVEEEEKIADILFLQTNKGWVIYHDDPDLKDPSYEYFHSAQPLIESLKGKAVRPLS